MVVRNCCFSDNCDTNPISITSILAIHCLQTYSQIWERRVTIQGSNHRKPQKVRPSFEEIPVLLWLTGYLSYCWSIFPTSKQWYKVPINLVHNFASSQDSKMSFKWAEIVWNPYLTQPAELILLPFCPVVVRCDFGNPHRDVSVAPNAVVQASQRAKMQIFILTSFHVSLVQFTSFI